MLIDSFQIKKGSVISFVGAGGKTSLIHLLTRKFFNLKFKILVTTTTSMFNPNFSMLNYEVLLFGCLSTFNFFFNNLNGIFFAAKKYDVKKNKLIGYSPVEIDLISKTEIFDYIFIEADGSDMMPTKLHEIFEPIIPTTSMLVVGCLSAKSLEKTIIEFLHRSFFFLNLTLVKI